jgi:vacuolar-type H+-ATPase subunit C/Vma6
MTDGLLFANAVAKVKEQSLFGEERLFRLLESPTLADAVRILAEANYGGGIVTDDPSDFEKALSAEERLAVEFIRQLKLDIGTDCFLLYYDYHNIKSLLKSLYGGSPIEQSQVINGLCDIEELKGKLVADNPDINPYADEAVKAIRKAFENARSPRLIDVLIDKAMYKDITARLARKSTDPHIRRYFEALIDLTNMDTMIRSQNIGAGFTFFGESFLEGGKMPLAAFSAVYEGGAEGFAALTKGTDYEKVASKFNDGGLPSFSAAKDDYLLDIFRAEKSDIFTAAPVVGYYLAKKQEIKMLRIALVCIKNDVDRAEIRKRMRALYA